MFLLHFKSFRETERQEFIYIKNMLCYSYINIVYFV